MTQQGIHLILERFAHGNDSISSLNLNFVGFGGAPARRGSTANQPAMRVLFFDLEAGDSALVNDTDTFTSGCATYLSLSPELDLPASSLGLHGQRTLRTSKATRSGAQDTVRDLSRVNEEQNLRGSEHHSLAILPDMSSATWTLA